MFKSEIFKNVSILSSGTVLAQLIPLLCAPIIARLFNAQDFGEFAAIMAVLNIFSVIVNGRYELTIVLPKDANRADSLLISSWIIGFALAIIFFISSVPLFDFISNYFQIEFGFLESFYVTISLMGIAIWQPLNYFFIRRKEYLKMTYNKFVKAISTVSVTILVGYFFTDYSINGLTLGLVIGWVLLATFSFIQGPFHSFRMMRKSANNGVEVLKEYVDYPKYNAFPALLNSFASQLGVYVFVYFYSTEIAGHYSFSKQYLFAPLSILGLSLSQVFFQRITEKFNNKKSVIKELKYLFFFLVGIAIIVCAIVIPFSEPLFNYIFGDQWAISAGMSKLLILYFTLQFVVSPLSTVLHALKKVKLASVFPVIYLCSMMSLFLIESTSLEEFLPIYVLAESIPYIAYLMIIYYAIRQYENRLINNDLSITRS